MGTKGSLSPKIHKKGHLLLTPQFYNLVIIAKSSKIKISEGKKESKTGIKYSCPRNATSAAFKTTENNCFPILYSNILLHDSSNNTSTIGHSSPRTHSAHTAH